MEIVNNIVGDFSKGRLWKETDQEEEEDMAVKIDSFHEVHIVTPSLRFNQTIITQ